MTSNLQVTFGFKSMTILFKMRLVEICMHKDVNPLASSRIKPR